MTENLPLVWPSSSITMYTDERPTGINLHAMSLNLYCCVHLISEKTDSIHFTGPKNGTQNEHILSTQKKGKQKANNTSDIINRYTAYSLKPFIVVASLRLPFRIELTNDNLFNIHLSLSLSLSFRIGPLCTAIANEDCVLCMTK